MAQSKLFRPASGSVPRPTTAKPPSTQLGVGKARATIRVSSIKGSLKAKPGVRRGSVPKPVRPPVKRGPR